MRCSSQASGSSLVAANAVCSSSRIALSFFGPIIRLPPTGPRVLGVAELPLRASPRDRVILRSPLPSRRHRPVPWHKSLRPTARRESPRWRRKCVLRRVWRSADGGPTTDARARGPKSLRGKNLPRRHRVQTPRRKRSASPLQPSGLVRIERRLSDCKRADIRHVRQNQAPRASRYTRAWRARRCDGVSRCGVRLAIGLIPSDRVLRRLLSHETRQT